MTVSERHDELLRRLRSRSDWRTEDLAAELGVSTRTILRDIGRLRDRGFEISSMSGPGGGVHLEPTSVLVSSQLTGEEVVALILSAAIAQAFPSMPFASGARSALAKVEASLPYERAGQLQTLMSRIMVGVPLSNPVGGSGEVSPLLARIFEAAFTNQQSMGFSYLDRMGKASQRVVQPHGLLVRAPLWYVIAWDTGVDELRLFRADRIRSAHLLADRFIPRPYELVRQICPSARPVSMGADTDHVDGGPG